LRNHSYHSNYCANIFKISKSLIKVVGEDFTVMVGGKFDARGMVGGKLCRSDFLQRMVLV